MKLGIFDSGVGGVTVLKELLARLPDAEFIYLGDNAHVPYGTKSPSQIRTFSSACAQLLKSESLDAVIVACNTASCLALDVFQEILSPVPVFGVLEPGVAAVAQTLSQQTLEQQHLPVVVFATRATVASGAYGRALKKALSTHCNDIYEQACPLLVPLIEEGWLDHPVLRLAVREYIAQLPVSIRSKQGVALLGCTHFPWIQKAFEAELPGWIVVNSAGAVADAVTGSEPNSAIFEQDSEKAPKVRWIFTDPDAAPLTRELMRMISGEPALLTNVNELANQILKMNC